MKISQNYTYNYPKLKSPVLATKSASTVFKSSRREFHGDTFQLTHCPNTAFFRWDMDWKGFAQLLGKKFHNTNTVNIIDYGCSTGEEPSSLVMILDKLLGKNANKFYPIKAFDIEHYNIESAKEGILKANEKELNKIKELISDEKFKDYFDAFKDSNDPFTWLSAKNNLLNKIEFAQSDITKDFNKIPKRNTVLLCRNFWPYLSVIEQKTFIKNLSSHLSASTLVVLGEFDTMFGTDKYFLQNGFKKTKIKYVYEKMSKNEMMVKKLFGKLKTI